MATSQELLSKWQQRMRNFDAPLILDTGTKQWEGSPIEDHSVNAPHGKWIGTDIEAGNGVDLVADLEIIDITTLDKFDGVFSMATLEHVSRPWRAIESICKAMNQGGWLFLHSHQTFPLHGYPHDYFRFSGEALRVMAQDAGFDLIETAYEFPCTITPPMSVTRWNTLAECFLNVNVLARKQ